MTTTYAPSRKRACKQAEINGAVDNNPYSSNGEISEATTSTIFRFINLYLLSRESEKRGKGELLSSAKVAPERTNLLAGTY